MDGFSGQTEYYYSPAATTILPRQIFCWATGTHQEALPVARVQGGGVSVLIQKISGAGYCVLPTLPKRARFTAVFVQRQVRAQGGQCGGLLEVFGRSDDGDRQGSGRVRLERLVNLRNPILI